MAWPPAFKYSSQGGRLLIPTWSLETIPSCMASSLDDVELVLDVGRLLDAGRQPLGDGGDRCLQRVRGEQQPAQLVHAVAVEGARRHHKKEASRREVEL
eukprot:CAMPEP_0185382380 /NCGR_PEP_ID=MMETSP1364-20130426/55113_1 /TAXON_ID=38817 /ORGANISM="Gephyrocapsa oceanica, Strain RCC1303" /LENGTH=98 /DNA_ID=CAMNT_0027984069 /DNA_START=8 /DNA_END=302 /DNA_ORIENTATION=-